MSSARLQALLERSLTQSPTYPEVGGTRAAVLDGGPLPPGYHHLRYQRLLGRGEDVFEAAAASVMSWGTHRGVGFQLAATSDVALEGATVAFGIGRGPLVLPASCRVVWTVDEPGRRGFGYGTLPRHPEDGEEAFVVSTDSAGRVWMELVAFSNPGRWYTRVAGFAVPVVQRFAVAAYARAVQRDVDVRPGRA
jgi:uncharacterized protein (UPF0548 family)